MEKFEQKKMHVTYNKHDNILFTFNLLVNHPHGEVSCQNMLLVCPLISPLILAHITCLNVSQ